MLCSERLSVSPECVKLSLMTIKHTNQPLFLPRGSVRSLLALIIVGSGVTA